MALSSTLEEKTVTKMVDIYCQGNHGSTTELCADCNELLAYSKERIDKCPFGEQKPVCGKCTVHCYAAQQREAIKKVMRYAGPRMLYKSPLLTVRYLYRKAFKSAKNKKVKA
ncbi:MAG TPA: nitrous oxide-stimulated promoter family protein [Oscillospiraceae bacterium]|nr:nitrous oxide-stimulated promoter family protein [Oscillospiraceae bacterium]